MPQTRRVRLVSPPGRLREQYRFLHWHLAFPQVFYLPGKDEEPDNGGAGWSGGFDVVLGNPPWEQINLMEREFFASRVPEITNAPNAAARKRSIRALERTDPSVWQEYRTALRDAEALGLFARASGRYPLTSTGRINTYQLFAGLARALIAPDGRAGIVVPTGIATDYNNRESFADLVGTDELASLYDFENRRGLFPASHRSYKFSLLTLRGSAWGEEAAEFAFFLHDVHDLADPERRFALTAADFHLLNPNTHTCPIFRTRRDAELTRKLYQAAPVLHDEQTGENPWGVSFKQGLFNMSSDSHLFRAREQLETQGFVLRGNRLLRGEQVYLPLYEAKMLWHYDHRSGSYAGVSGRTDTHLPAPTRQEKADPSFVVQPWYWVERSQVADRLSPDVRWVLAFRDITNTTNERTGVFALFQWTAVSNKAPVLLLGREHGLHAPAFLANLDSMPFDFILRQKMGGTSLNFYILKQLPVLPSERYTPDQLAYVVPRVLELTYTAWDLRPFAVDCGYDGPPFRWDEGRRFLLRCELDAAYFHLYGVERDDVDYIMETFPIVKRKDEKAHGEYLTKRVILEIYDEMARAMKTGEPYGTRLDPPPADPRVAHSWDTKPEWVE